ncbi:MAG: hypothetical protein LW823_05010 [Rickettsiales bacterium]|jgi:hypothetical protein|nr:hypothetical protein [Rickettsiales bacterium]
MAELNTAWDAYKKLFKNAISSAIVGIAIGSLIGAVVGIAMPVTVGLATGLLAGAAGGYIFGGAYGQIRSMKEIKIGGGASEQDVVNVANMAFAQGYTAGKEQATNSPKKAEEISRQFQEQLEEQRSKVVASAMSR